MNTGAATALVVLTFVIGSCGGAADPGTTSAETPPASPVAISTSTTLPRATTTPSPSTIAAAPSTSPTTEPTECAVAGLSAVPAEQELPQAVAEVREAIVAAAVTCDIDALASLTAADFTYSFGGDGDPADYWKDVETRSATEGEASALAILVRLLDLPFATIETSGTTYYVWPSAHGYGSWDDVPPADRDALLGLYGAQDLADFASFGSYVGYRIGITADGDWSYFVAGD